MMLLSNRRQRGFTLIETIIVVALFAIMLFALFDFYINYNATYLHEEAVVKTASSAGAVVKEVTVFTAAAGQVLASRAFDGTTHVSGTSTLILELPSMEESGDIIDATYDYALFYIEDGVVYQVIDADNESARSSGTKRLSDATASLVFTYDSESFPDVSTVTVDIVTLLTVKGSSVEQHLTQQATLRNNTLL